jgi:hypothetical protein
MNKDICKICGERLGEWATYPNISGNYHVACVDKLVSWFRNKGYRIDFSSLEIKTKND